MKNDKRLDEAFRKGLPSVEVPPAPTQDWAALARAAKQGARAAAVRDSGSVLNVRWLKLLGGASAILTAWYLAFGPQAAPHAPAHVAASTDTPAAHAEFIGGTPAELIGMVSEQPAGVPSTVELATSAVKTGEPLSQNATAPKVAGHKQEMEAKRGDAGGTGLRVVTSPRAGSSDGNKKRSSGMTSNSIVERDDHAEMQDGSHPEASMRMDAGTTTGDLGTEATAGVTGRDSRENITVLGVLPPLPAALPYTPNDPSAQATTSGPSLAHWSIAPWFSLGHTTWTDPENGDNGYLDQLNVGHEPPSSIGLRIQYAFDHRLAMITGIQYARKGSLRGTVRSSPFITTDYELSGDYLEVPISLKFALPLENKEFYVRAGGLLQFNMHSGMDKVAMNDASHKELSTLVLARGSMGTALDIGIGAQFRLSRRLGLFIEPSYQYALSPVVKHPSFDKLPFNPRIHSFSLATGLSFQFP